MEQIKASSEWELTVTCAGCDTVVPTASCQSNLPEAGIIFPFANLGYYDGFSDDCEERPDEEWEGKFPMCHDCTVKILDAVPALQAKIVNRYGRGLHQTKNKNHEPCCRYSFLSIDNQDGETSVIFYPDESLKWYPSVRYNTTTGEETHVWNERDSKWEIK